MGFVPFKLMRVSESSLGGKQQQLELTGWSLASEWTTADVYIPNILDALDFYFGRRLVCLFPTGGTSNLAKSMDFIGAVASVHLRTNFVLKPCDLPVPLMVTISQAVDGALFAKETEDFKLVNTDQSAA